MQVKPLNFNFLTDKRAKKQTQNKHTDVNITLNKKIKLPIKKCNKMTN